MYEFFICIVRMMKMPKMWGYIKLKLHWRAKWLRIILYGIIPQTVFLLEDKIDFCYERTLKYKFRMV